MQGKYEIKRHNLRFTKISEKWVDGIFLGNGEIGAMIWGNGSPLKISLDKMDYWENRWDPKGIFGPEHNWEDMQQLVREKNYQKLTEKYQLYMGETVPWLLQPTRLPLPRLEILFASEFHKMDLQLNIENAQVEGTLNLPEQVLKMHGYVHANQNFMLYQFQALDGQMPDFQVKVDDSHLDETAHGNLQGWGYPSLALGSKNTPNGVELFYAYQETPENKGGLLILWQILKGPQAGKITLHILTQGNLPKKKQQDVEAGNSTWFNQLFAYGAERFDWFIKNGASVNLADHTQWWHEYWAKSMISIPDNILENLYYIELYKLACNSRWGKYPCTLQGIWTLDGGMPPWAGDYHLDMNVQETYWPIYVNNRLELGEPLFRWISDNIPQFKERCKRFYGCEGIHMGCALTLKGDNLHGYYNTENWPGNGTWMAHMFWLYWRFTQDKCFLLHKAFPVMQGCMALYEHLLVKEGGEYEIPLSSSPEFFENDIKAWGRNPTCDIALIRWLVDALLETVPILKLDTKPEWVDRIAKWKDISENLTYYPADLNGFQIFEGQPYSFPHRHMTHLFPVHPFHQVTVESDNPDDQYLIESSIKNLRKIGNWKWLGWTLPWLSMMGSWIRNPWLAYKWAKDYCLFIKDNSMHINGDPDDQGICGHIYGPMTLEAGFCFAAAIPEMLIQSWGRVIRLFPCLPKSWHDVKFRNLRAEGGFLISSDLNEDQLQWIWIRSEVGTECSLKLNKTGSFLLINFENGEILKQFEATNSVLFETTKEKEYLVIPNKNQTEAQIHTLIDSLQASEQELIAPVQGLFREDVWFGTQKTRKNPYLP